MKIILTILAALTVCVPVFAHADNVSPDDAWSFLYEFPLSRQGARIVSDGTYHMTTGDAPALTAGSWSLVIVDGAKQPLMQYFFDAASFPAGKSSLIVPAENRGASAYITDPSGQRIVEIDLRESRICNDDGVCSGDAGERSTNCPTDCGRLGENDGARSAQTASIVSKTDFGEQAGKALIRVSLGAAGLMLLAGLARILDSRRRA